MEFELKGFGMIKIDEDALLLECDLNFPLESLYKDFPEKVKNLSESAKTKLKKAAFLMSINMVLMQREVKSMRICGAAKFIPSQLKKDEE